MHTSAKNMLNQQICRLNDWIILQAPMKQVPRLLLYRFANTQY